MLPSISSICASTSTTHSNECPRTPEETTAKPDKKDKQPEATISVPQSVVLPLIPKTTQKTLKTIQLEASDENLIKIQDIVYEWLKYTNEKITLLDREEHQIHFTTFQDAKTICKCILFNTDPSDISSIYMIKNRQTDTVEAIALVEEIDISFLSRTNAIKMLCTELIYLLTNPKNIRSSVNEPSLQVHGAAKKAVYSVLKKSSTDGLFIQSLEQACSFYKKIGCEQLDEQSIDIDTKDLVPFWITKEVIPKKEKNVPRALSSQ